MTLTGERAATALRALEPSEIDGITELDTRGDKGWEAIVLSLCSAVANAYAEGRFDDPETAADTVREIGYAEVPSMNRQIIDELVIIGMAYDYQTDADVTGLPLVQIIAQVLADVYTDGAQALVDWVNEQEDDEDHQSGNCQHCGALLHWDAEAEGFRDDGEDEFCEDGTEHERAEGV